LANLQTVPKPRVLLLGYTQVTDAGLESLKSLTQLRKLDLRKTKVTDAGVAKLLRALPNCYIYHR